MPATTVDASGPRFWVNTVSLDHVEEAARGGFTQSDHGASTRLVRMRAGDGLVFYSPRTEMGAGAPVQQFTAIAVITGEAPYQVTQNPDFTPWRLDARYERSRRVDAKSLVGQLSFISDPTHWGLPFRRGLFSIPEGDFEIIRSAMVG
jgi:hypothetical protein